jgi:hypothetical protein
MEIIIERIFLLPGDGGLNVGEIIIKRIFFVVMGDELDGREIIIKRLEKMLDVINKIQPFFGSKK